MKIDTADCLQLDRDFDRAVRQIAPGGSVAVAVSGGSDSTALLYLAARHFSESQGPLPVVLTVDHGLRAESAGEARKVAGWAKELGLKHITLLWQSDKPSGDLQAAARQARYRLMADYCLTAGIQTLMTAHTQDDQAETFLLRLARGSGLDGLSAMSPSAPVPLDDVRYDGLQLVRPLLNVSRARLQQYLSALGRSWIDDPSNEDDSFARVRFRRLLPMLAREGLTATRLAQTAQRLRLDRDLIEQTTADWAAACLTVDEAGYILLDSKEFAAAPMPVALRVLGQALRAVGAATYRPRANSLQRLYHDLTGGGLSRARTLAGCHIAPLDDGRRCMIAREWRALARTLGDGDRPACIQPGEAMIWDRRFVLRLVSRDRPDMTLTDVPVVRPLGQTGWRKLTRLCRDQGWTPPQVPAGVRACLPGLWLDDQLISAVPLGKVKTDAWMDDVGAHLRFEGRFHSNIH